MDKKYEIMMIEVGYDKKNGHEVAFGYVWSSTKNMAQWVFDRTEDRVFLNRGLLPSDVISEVRAYVEGKEEEIQRGEYVQCKERLKECAKIIAELSYHGWKIQGGTP